MSTCPCGTPKHPYQPADYPEGTQARCLHIPPPVCRMCGLPEQEGKHT